MVGKNPKSSNFSSKPIVEFPIDSLTEFLLYKTDVGKVSIQTRLQDETIWLTQPQMSELFQTTQQNISLHIQNIYSER